MTSLSQPAALAIAPVLLSAFQSPAAAADPAAALGFNPWRLAPDQIAGAYSLLARRSARPKTSRPETSRPERRRRTPAGDLFYPK